MRKTNKVEVVSDEFYSVGVISKKSTMSDEN